MPEMASIYKVVLLFTLKPGRAEEELRRSREAESFPMMLAQQPGFAGMELVRVNDDQTMSLQSWSSAEDWWAALDAVKSAIDDRGIDDRESILVDRRVFAGPVVLSLSSANG